MSGTARSTNPVEAALTLVREGRLVDAESLVKGEVSRAAQEHGEGSPAWASAQCDMGNVLLRADQPAWAAECFRAAAAADPGDDPDARRDRLTYQLNLGIALSRGGRLEEAAEALRRSCDQRLEFYGRDHAGYAFGLEPLADVLLRLGDVKGAREAADEALRNFWRNGHERVVTAVALRAVVLQAAGDVGALFPGLADLPDEMVEQVAEIATARVLDGGPLDDAYRLILHLSLALDSRLGPDHETTLNTVSHLAALAGQRGDHTGRIAAIQRLLDAYDRLDRGEEAVMAAVGLALALADAGDQNSCLRTYESAAARADKLDRADLSSGVLRNWGLALADAGEEEPAAQRLAEAVAAARRGADPSALGSASIVHGIFLQHHARLPEARAALEEGLAATDPVSQAAQTGRAHLMAVLDGRPCGC